MSLGHLDNYELLRHDYVRGYETECAKRFEQLVNDADAIGAVVEGGIDIDQPLDELTEEVKTLLDKEIAFEDLVRSLLEKQIEEHEHFYQSAEYLDQLYFENIFSRITHHPEMFFKYLEENNFPVELSYEIQEGIAKNDIKGYWEIAKFNTVENNLLTCDPLGLFTELPNDDLIDALSHFEVKDFLPHLTDDKDLYIDLSDCYPCYCVRPENVEKYLQENYREEYDRIRTKRA